jgi:hypothetical protein
MSRLEWEYHGRPRAPTPHDLLSFPAPILCTEDRIATGRCIN